MVLQEDLCVMMTQPSSKSLIRAGMSIAILAASLCAANPETLRANDGPPAAERLAPAAESLAPAAPISGTLFICGGGKLPDKILNEFVRLAGGRDASIVIVTTASETADTGEVDKNLEFWLRQRIAQLSVLHTREREIADDPKFTEPLTTATGVWFIGGHQQRLTDAYLGTRTEKAIKAVLKRGGVVGGTSAGAAIMSQAMIAGGGYPIPGGGITEPEIGYGFGFLPGTLVDQHFIKRKRRHRLEHALAKYPKLVGIGIDENTALVVHGRRISVLGDSSVETYLPPVGDKPGLTSTLLDGMEDDLLALHRAAQARLNPRFRFDDDKLEPGAARGTLVIAGGGDVPEAAAERFIKAAGGPDADIVVVTTANGDKPTADAPAVVWLANAGAKNIHLVHPRTRADADAPAFLALLQKAGGVWFVGGRQWRLVDVFEHSAAEKEFHAVLHRGGAIGGNGGGASMLADYLVRGGPLSNRDIMAEGYEEGFGFIQGVAIDPFFTKRIRFPDMAKLKRAHPRLIGLGVDEETALVIQQHAFEVVGKNHVVVYGHSEKAKADKEFEFLYGGDKYDLASRSRLGPPRDTTNETPLVAAAPADGDEPEPQPPLACDE
jgi:cyanophycinase